MLRELSNANNVQVLRLGNSIVVIFVTGFTDNHRDLNRTKEERIFGEGILLRYWICAYAQAPCKNSYQVQLRVISGQNGRKFGVH